KIYNAYGNIFSDMGQKDKSISIFNEAIGKFPAYTSLYFNKGLNLFTQERFAEAESVFKQTLLINPYQYSAHFYLGLCAIQQGKMIPGFLSIIGYLLINPDGKYSARCINILDAISRGKDEMMEYKSKRKDDGDENYALAEEILFSKIALEKQYKLQVSFDDAVFRQIQVVLEKLEYNEDDPDFWMQYYVPYYKQIFNEKQFEPFIFWTFQNVTIKEIKDYNNKNKKTLDNFTTHTAEYFNQIRATRTLAYNKREGQTERFLYADGKFQGKGALTTDGKNFVGPWTFCFPEGNIKSTGNYQNFEREGIWTFYYYSGRLKAKENYKNGKLDGNQLYYSEKGLMTYDENYLNEKKDGRQTEYYINGQIYSIANYNAGKIDGEYKEYYSGSQIRLIKHFSNDIASGTFLTYYNNGQQKESGNYINGKLEGPYIENLENGKPGTDGMFKNDQPVGEWKYYYDNGKMKSRSQLVNGKIEGLEEEYYEEGMLESTYNYKKGKINGESVSMDKDQKQYAKFLFSDGILVSAAYFDKTGKQISSSERNNNGLDLNIFLSDGSKSTHRIFNAKGEKTGIETSFYPSGKTRTIIEYKDDEKDGLSTDFYRNGNKQSEVRMENGKQNGKLISYYLNGKIESEGWYVQGQEQGLWKYYDEMGNLVNKSYFLDGQLNGYKTEYYPNGVKSTEKKFYRGWVEDLKQFDTTGKLLAYDSFPQFNGKYLLLYPNGNKMLEVNYVKGAFDGRLTQYYFDGSIESILYYKNGLADSNYNSFHYHQVKSTEGQYKSGKKTGLWKYYDEKGRMTSTDTFVNDLLDGSRVYYGNDNKIELEIQFKKNERNGLSTFKDPDGSLLYTIRYDNGIVKGYTYTGSDGKMVPEITAELGSLQLNSFFQNGKLSRKCQFIDGKVNGTDILYYTTGQMRSQDSSICGTYEGMYIENFPNGKPNKKYYYYQGNMHGICRDYNDQGILIKESNFYNGMLNGPSKYFSDSGQLKETRYYYFDHLLFVKN
ncbi:MAG TPA: hypothetical protein VII28_08480, partial [Puia sp.]